MESDHSRASSLKQRSSDGTDTPNQRKQTPNKIQRRPLIQQFEDLHTRRLGSRLGLFGQRTIGLGHEDEGEGDNAENAHTRRREEATATVWSGFIQRRTLAHRPRNVEESGGNCHGNGRVLGAAVVVEIFPLSRNGVGRHVVLLVGAEEGRSADHADGGDVSCIVIISADFNQDNYPELRRTGNPCSTGQANDLGHSESDGVRHGEIKI